MTVPETARGQSSSNWRRTIPPFGCLLSRNFGQHAAITAGLSYAHGEWVVVMDCDLQDPPEEIPRLYGKALEGHDIVFGRRTNKPTGGVRRSLASLYFRSLRLFTRAEIDVSTGRSA